MIKYEMRVSPDGEMVAVRTGDTPYAPWRVTQSGLSLDDTRVADWTPVPVGAQVLADLLVEWAAHWPPSTADAPETEPLYAPLDRMSPAELEQLAVSASELSRRAWDVRHEKMVADVRSAGR